MGVLGTAPRKALEKSPALAHGTAHLINLCQSDWESPVSVVTPLLVPAGHSSLPCYPTPHPGHPKHGKEA